VSTWFRETFASLRIPAYRTFSIAVLLNFGALWMAIVSRGFLTFELTDSAAALGAIFLGFGLPMLLLGPIGGVVADRYPRKLIVVISQWSFVVTNTVIAALVIADAVEFWMIFVAAVAEGAGVALGIPARQALIGDLVEEEDLGNAVALQQVSFNAVRIIAPTLAGALIAIDSVGLGGSYALQSVGYAAAALVMARVPVLRARAPVEHQLSPWRSIAEGVGYVRSRPALRTLVLIAYSVELTAFSYFVLTPAVVKDLFDGGSVALGLMTTAIAVGAFGASVVVARIADRESAWSAHIFAAFIFGPILIAFAASPIFAVAAVVGIAVGAAETGFISLNQSLAMRYSHGEFYGRVQSVLMFGFALNGLVGYPAGLAADAFGLRPTLIGLGAISTVLVVIAVTYARRIDARADALTPSEQSSDAGVEQNVEQGADAPAPTS